MLSQNKHLFLPLFKRPLTFLCTVFFTLEWRVVCQLISQRCAFTWRNVADRREHLPASFRRAAALLGACTTGMRGAPWMTWCQSVNTKRRPAFRAPVQHNQTLTSLAGIEQTYCYQLIIFYHDNIQAWSNNWKPPQVKRKCDPIRILCSGCV